MNRENAEKKPRVNHRNKYLRRVLHAVGGLDTFAEEVKRRAEEDNLYTIAQAASL